MNRLSFDITLLDDDDVIVLDENTESSDKTSSASTSTSGITGQKQRSRSRSPSLYASDCSETVEDVIEAAKLAYYRDVAKELELEKEAARVNATVSKDFGNLSKNKQMLLRAFTIKSTKRPLLRKTDFNLNNAEEIDPLSSIPTKRQKVQCKDVNSNDVKQSSSSKTTMSTKNKRFVQTAQRNQQERKLTLEQQQAFLLCRLQISDQQLKDPEFMAQLQTTHPQLKGIHRARADHLIDNYERELRRIVRKKANSIKKLTLMLNAVKLDSAVSETILIFVSIAHYIRPRRQVRTLFLGMKRFKVDKSESFQVIEPVIKQIFDDYDLSLSQIICVVHSGFEDLQIQAKFAPTTLLSYHDHLKNTFDSVFESNVSVLRIERKLNAVFSQFCKNDSAKEEFAQMTGVQLNADNMSFDQLSELFRAHRQKLASIGRKHLGNLFQSLKQDEIDNLDELKRLKDLCQSHLQPTVDNQIITIDYVYPLLKQFLEALRTSFNELESVAYHLEAEVQNRLQFMLDKLHPEFNGVYLNSTALNNQLCGYLGSSTTWKGVLRKELCKCYHKMTSLSDNTSSLTETLAASKYVREFFHKYETKIETCFDSQIEPNDEVNVNYSAISFWEQFDDEQLHKIATNPLQIVPVTLISTSNLKGMLSDWISNQDTYPHNSFITANDSATVDRNCFIYFNQRFLF